MRDQLPGLLYVAKQLGELEAISKYLMLPDSKLDDAKRDMKVLYNAMIENIGMSERMKSQEAELSRDSWDVLDGTLF